MRPPTRKSGCPDARPRLSPAASTPARVHLRGGRASPLIAHAAPLDRQSRGCAPISGRPRPCARPARPPASDRPAGGRCNRSASSVGAWSHVGAFLGSCEQHRHRLRMHRPDHSVRLGGQEREQAVIFRDPVGVLGLRAAHAGPGPPDTGGRRTSGRASPRANHTGVLRGRVSAYSLRRSPARGSGAQA